MFVTVIGLDTKYIITLSAFTIGVLYSVLTINSLILSVFVSKSVALQGTQVEEMISGIFHCALTSVLNQIRQYQQTLSLTGLSKNSNL